jgi:hypothetical protein
MLFQYVAVAVAVVFQEHSYRFQYVSVAVVLFLKNLDVVFKVLLLWWCCFSRT